MAFALVDYNGDGDLSPEEFTKFYKEIFLPVVELLQDTKPEMFAELNKYSALSAMYEQVKDGKYIKLNIMCFT